MVGQFTSMPIGYAHAYIFDGEIHDIDQNGEHGSYPASINNSDKIVGRIYNDGSTNKIFIYDNDSLNIIDNADYPHIFPQDINDKGQIVGYFRGDAGLNQAFLMEGTVFNDVSDLFNNQISSINAINNSGVYVGYYYHENSELRAFVCDGVSVVELHNATWQRSWASDINDFGHVVGGFELLNGETHIFFYDGNSITDLGKLEGSIGSSAESINNKGQIVGTAIFDDGSYSVNAILHAIIIENGEIFDLNELVNPDNEFVLRMATGINDNGEIVGNSFSRPFLLRPLPAFTVSIIGRDSVCGGDIVYYTAHARYGSSTDFDEYDVTDYVEWSIIAELDNCAEIGTSGMLTTYRVDDEIIVTIRATLTDLGETHWCDFPVLIDNLFQITGMTPEPCSYLTSAPTKLEIFFNEELNNGSINLNTSSLIKAGYDGLFDTEDDTSIPLFYSVSPDCRCITFDLTDSMLPNDTYQLRINGIKNLNGINVDGEFTGLFPSGDGLSGGEFKALFSINRQITSILFNDNDTVTLVWAPFRDNIVYRIDSRDRMDSGSWLPISPVEQFPIRTTSWTGSSWKDSNRYYRVIGVIPYIMSVMPSEGIKGTFSLFVDIMGYGTEWEDGEVSISIGDNVTINSISILSSTHIFAEIRISSTAECGFRDVIISTDTKVYIKENAFEILE
ncbi:MAG: DUF3466 family protein [Candidatus Auribacterota bacterium]